MPYSGLNHEPVHGAWPNGAQVRTLQKVVPRAPAASSVVPSPLKNHVLVTDMIIVERYDNTIGAASLHIATQLDQHLTH